GPDGLVRRAGDGDTGAHAQLDRRRTRARPAARRRVRHDGGRAARLDDPPRRRHVGARAREGRGVTGHGVADPVTLQIVGNALASIADEMATTIFRTAHSTVVRDGMDFSAAVCDARGETVAQAVTVPFHLGSIPAAMERLLHHYRHRLRPGDVFVMNDPFDGGIHLQDLFVFKPVHLDGTLIGFTCTTAHHGDVGGRLPGSSACDNTEIFQEGIRLPWLRLYDRGEPVEDVFKIIEANVRIPRMTLGDLGAQVAACTVAERELQALARRYGAGELAALMDGLIEHTERLVRAEIASWPDGTATFTDHLDSDGIERVDVPIRATVTISGDEVIADLTESAPMVRGSLNSTRSFVEACAYQAVRSALTVEVPNTSGAFRPVTVLTKPGTVAEVVMPGASSMRGVTGFRVLDAVNGALAQLIPGRVAAAGEGGNTLAIFGAEDAAGERFVFYELVVGTWGATAEGDGNDGLTNPASLAANIPVEVAESEFPIVVERYGLVPDSGGPGRRRGGLAIERVWRCLTPDTSLIVRSDRCAHPPYGLAGGEPGALSANVLHTATGEVRELPGMFSTTIEAGDVYGHRTAGGGGFGDPFEREPELVAADVVDGKVSVATAADRYGASSTPREPSMPWQRRGGDTHDPEGGRRRDRRRHHRRERRALPRQARLRRRRARREAHDLRRLEPVLGRAHPAARLQRGRDPARRPRHADDRKRRGAARRADRVRPARLPRDRPARAGAGDPRRRAGPAAVRRRDVDPRGRGGGATLA
ncbi:MAG: hydantoinase B/oxoprolinase family protein, partial [Actinobacteria bacterium]|nr:hydantoinase B/oxoprolinase family protein [Actinomycetota bacterium]